jgi:hypothetical protein
MILRSDARVRFVASQFPPGRGELLPYLYFHSFRPFDKAVILHDAMFIVRPIDDLVASVDRVAFLWDFGPHYDQVEIVERMIREAPLGDADELQAMHRDVQRWTGCFGTCSVMAWEFLDEMMTRYGFPHRLAPFCDSRPARCALERVFALCCIMALQGAYPRALFGNIFNTPDCYSIKGAQFLEWQGLDPSSAARAIDTPRGYPHAIIKVWNDR